MTYERGVGVFGTLFSQFLHDPLLFPYGLQDQAELGVVKSANSPTSCA
jgi:hypothetical protein